jgi:hypothetical protein
MFAAIFTPSFGYQPYPSNTDCQDQENQLETIHHASVEVVHNRQPSV